MWTLYKKEILGFLSSITGWVVIGIFLTVTGLFLWVLPSGLNIPDGGYANLNGLFSLAPFVFLFLVPAVTMNSLAEEKRSGTLELLLIRPLSDTKIITAKYLAAFTLVVLSLLPTLIYYFSVYRLGYPVGDIDTAREADLPVHDQDLAMVAPRQLRQTETVVPRHHRVVLKHPGARATQLFEHLQVALP